MRWTKKTRSVYMHQKYASQRALFIAFLGGECAICGSKKSLEIDHKDPKQKNFSISKYWGNKKLAVVLEELKKCQVLCHRCHVKKSAMESSARMEGRFIHGTIYAWMKKHCICQICCSAKWKWNDARNAKRRNPDSRGPYLVARRGEVHAHGTNARYYRGCKCQPCRSAHACAVRLWRKTKRGEKD